MESPAIKSFGTKAALQIWLREILRIVAGLLFLAHGVVKLFGFPEAAKPGLQPMLSLLWTGGAIELVTGGLLVLGLRTRVAAFLASGEMAVGYWMFNAPRSLYPVLNQGDAAILFCFLFLYLASADPGPLSLDQMLSGHQPDKHKYR